MQYRRLGNCEKDVSILGMGCMRLPIIDGDEGRIDEVRATALLHQAIDAGIINGLSGGRTKPSY